jgi:hypothetical protein
MGRGRPRTVGGTAAEAADAPATYGPIREDLLPLPLPNQTPKETGGEVGIKYHASQWRKRTAQGMEGGDWGRRRGAAGMQRRHPAM